ncbi:MAG: hypothetical protein WC765_07640 [Phycisphaerae bacterium]|jgi:hypothetical protein
MNHFHPRITGRFFISIITATLVVVADVKKSIAEEVMASPNVEGQVKLFKQLVDVMAKGSFKNITLDFSSVVSKRTSNDPDWRVTSWSWGDICLASEPNSLIKVNYTPMTLTWENGAAPFLQEEMAFSNNGSYWTTNVRKRGPINAMSLRNTAEITEKCPARFEAPRINGVEQFLVSHAVFFGNSTLKQTLDEVLSMPPVALPQIMKNYTVRKEGSFIIVSCQASDPMTKGESIRAEMWVDLSKGGVLKQWRSERKSPSKNGESTVEVTVDEYANINGLWFPTRASRHYKDSVGEVKVEFRASHYTTKDDGSKLYDITLVPGTQVCDKRTNTNFVVGSTIEDTQNAIKAGIK